MIRPLLSLEHLSLDVREGQVGYRDGKEAKDLDLKLTFVPERPPPTHLAYQQLLTAAEASTEYSS